jgi:hypothetical protein
MPTPKAIPFARVRVLQSTEPGLYRPIDTRRADSGQRMVTPLAWRLHIRSSPPALAAPVPPQTDAAEDPEAPEVTDTVTDAEQLGGWRDNAEAGAADAGDTLEPAVPKDSLQDNPVIAPYRVERRTSAWLVDTDGIAPVDAVTRAVKESVSLQSVVDLIARTCDGEGMRETGPWELSLPLEKQGLGRSMLNLYLSREQLRLRFACDGPAQYDLIWQHSKSLQSKLEERLQIPIEIDITLSDS